MGSWANVTFVQPHFLLYSANRYLDNGAHSKNKKDSYC